jgi:hypothetical protein
MSAVGRSTCAAESERSVIRGGASVARSTVGTGGFGVCPGESEGGESRYTSPSARCGDRATRSATGPSRSIGVAGQIGGGGGRAEVELGRIGGDGGQVGGWCDRVGGAPGRFHNAPGQVGGWHGQVGGRQGQVGGRQGPVGAAPLPADVDRCQVSGGQRRVRGKRVPGGCRA